MRLEEEPRLVVGVFFFVLGVRYGEDGFAFSLLRERRDTILALREPGGGVWGARWLFPTVRTPLWLASIFRTGGGSYMTAAWCTIERSVKYLILFWNFLANEPTRNVAVWKRAIACLWLSSSTLLNALSAILRQTEWAFQWSNELRILMAPLVAVYICPKINAAARNLSFAFFSSFILSRSS